MKNEKNIFIDETTIVENNVTIGENTKIWHFSHIDENVVIGSNCIIGQNVYIGKGVQIGDNVKIQNNVSVYSGVTIEDNVFCGPSIVFTNDINPRSCYPKEKCDYQKTQICKGATIGANATIICGHTIEENAMVGAGTVVIRNIKKGELIVGNPQRHLGWVCKKGHKLNSNFICKICKEKYKLSIDGVEEIT